MNKETRLRIIQFQIEVMELSNSDRFRSLTEYEFMLALLDLLKTDIKVKLTQRDKVNE